MSMNERMIPREEKSSLWSRRKFLKASLITSVATAGFLLGEQPQKTHAISSPESSNPFRSLRKNAELYADVSTGAGVRQEEEPATKKSDAENKQNTSQIKYDFLEWSPEKISSFVNSVTPIRWSNGKNVEWGITKTGDLQNSDEFVFSGIYQGSGQDHVIATDSKGNKFNADLTFMLLLVPTKTKDVLIPTKFYLFQNMETTGILGYTMINPEKDMIPVKRGQGGSMNAVPLKNEQLEKLHLGTAVAVVSPSSGLTFTETELQNYYETRPEAVVATIKNGKLNSSYKNAEKELREKKPTSIYAADWIFISTTQPKQ